MSDLYASIKRGLEEAVAHQQGEKTGVRLFTPEAVDVKLVRQRTGLTQEQFATTFGISLGTLRHWERGDRKPHGPALVLLNAVAREPATVLRILTGQTKVGAPRQLPDRSQPWSLIRFLSAPIRLVSGAGPVLPQPAPRRSANFSTLSSAICGTPATRICQRH